MAYFVLLTFLEITDAPVVTETYSCARLYKCYAVNQTPYKLFILYTAKIPTYAMGWVG